MKLAVYDMDKTVTRRPTYTPFLLHMAKKRAPWRFAALPLVGASLAAYGLKAIDRARLKEINHALLLGDVPRDDIVPHLDSFAAATLAENIRPGAISQIARDKADGYTLVMATASYRFYAEAIGKAVGFDHVLGTEAVEGADGRLCARIEGENCYADAKLRIFDAWLAREGIAVDVMRFYSDHHSDAPMFERADEAVAINPDDKLAALAKERGWRIEDWG